LLLLSDGRLTLEVMQTVTTDGFFRRPLMLIYQLLFHSAHPHHSDRSLPT